MPLTPLCLAERCVSAIVAAAAAADLWLLITPFALHQAAPTSGATEAGATAARRRTSASALSAMARRRASATGASKGGGWAQ